ncbi:hypothetical protein EXIGLDRAFT_836188 [Exidia glandulosa HHB12029]|uniref:Uncharacterized protein n=1 Tax=Exidia glandulosa HHB12029 TaxID=1314781 RepID=A0A165I0X4_EXIGL|nr:hypothetical protein EXIGLDRAFT_836188 [Exidia glandulosa HHB12029]
MISLFFVPLYFMSAVFFFVVLPALLPWPPRIRVRIASFVTVVVSAAASKGFVVHYETIIADLRNDLVVAELPETMLHWYKGVFSGLDKAEQILKDPDIERFWRGAPLRFRAASHVELICIRLTDNAYASKEHSLTTYTPVNL